MQSLSVYLWLVVCCCILGCSQPSLQEGKVKITSTADLGKVAGVKSASTSPGK